MAFIAPAKLIIAPAQLIPAQLITAPAQLITAPAQPPATKVVVYTALFLNFVPFRKKYLRYFQFWGKPNSQPVG